MGTVLTVVGALTATLLGGGLATRRSDILDGNTWLTSTRDGLEHLLRVNGESGEVDIDRRSPIPPGHLSTLQQSNAGTALIDATTGDTFAWNAVGAKWVPSTTKVTGQTALHLTTDSAFTVDRADGTVRQLDPTTLSAEVGPPLSLRSAISDSIIDGSGALWLALAGARRVVSVINTDHGPALTHDYPIDSSGSALALTALKAGTLVADAAGHRSYRIFGGREAAERIAGTPTSATAIIATSSDDDTGAVLDRSSKTVTRVAPLGDSRAASFHLDVAIGGHTFGRPVVFGNRIYVPDYTTSKVLRSNERGGFTAYPPDPMGAAGGMYELFVDDGRLWVNARSGAKAFAIDESGRWTSITKFDRRRISLPKALPKPKPTHPTSSGSPPPPPRRPTPSGPGGPPSTKTPSPPPTSTPTIKAQPPPNSPTNLDATVEDGSISLTWQAPTTGAQVTGYELSWTGPDGNTQTAKLSADASDRTITRLENGTEYQITLTPLSGSGDGTPASATATPLTKAGVEVTGLRATGRGRISVDFTTAPHGSGSVTCQLIVNGTERWNGSCDGGDSKPVDNLPVDSDVDVYLQATNSKGSTTSEHRSVHTWPAPSVTISKGASARGQGSPTCVDPSCAWINVHLENFNPGQSLSMTADSTRGGGFPTRTVTPGSDGKLDITGGPGVTYYFGYSGSSVWVIVDGVESQHLTW